jgi:hypothetical protein
VCVLVLLVAVGALHRGLQAEEAPTRDPMRPFGADAAVAGTDVATGPRFTLTGVLIAPTRRVAMINGRPYMQGENVDGAEIVAIERNAVRLREQGNELVISLGRPAQGRPPPVQGETAP